MGLAINGNVVHGIARGGQAFVSVGNATNADGSINIDGQNYLGENNMKLNKISEFTISGGPGNTADITRDLSNYAGYLAIFKVSRYTNFTPSADNESFISQPIIIPTSQATENLSLLDLSMDFNYHFSLSRTTDNTFLVSDDSQAENIDCRIFILSNEAS